MLGGAEAQTEGATRADAEVPLAGVLSEFRQALRAEIETARRASRNSAVQLVHGERIGRVADGHQYLFKVESPQMALPDDLPGDLYLPGRDRLDAIVVSLAGSALTLWVTEDLGAYVPRASLSGNLTNLLLKLISRIEDISKEGRENHAGARLLGESAVSGALAEDASIDLNPEQSLAVASGLGRDTTFIQGPPGTGKTKTIGTLGEQLARADRTVLLVSHTNSAVDQALLHIARALGPDAAAAGKVLRLGAPKDERVAAQPDLLVKTHVERRSADLLARRAALQAEAAAGGERLGVVLRLLATCAWAVGARERRASAERLRGDVKTLGEHLRRLDAEVAAEEERVGHWEPVRAEARAAQARVEERAQLAEAVKDARTAAELTDLWRREAVDVLPQQTEARREQVREETRQLVVNARATVEEARSQQRLHRAQLEQARQAVWTTERLEQLPEAAFTRARVEQLRADVDEQGARAGQAAQEHYSAKALLEPAAASTQDRMLRHQAELATSRRELMEAEQRLRETESLEAELDQSRGLPSVEEAEALLEHDERDYHDAISNLVSAESESKRRRRQAARDAKAHVRDGLARAEAAVEDAERNLEAASLALRECGEAIEAFAAAHHAPPAELLAQADEALAQLDLGRNERKETHERRHSAERELRELLETERTALSGIGHDVAAADLDVLFGAVSHAMSAAFEDVTSYDTDALRREESELRARVQDIETEVADLDEQLQAIEAAVIAETTVLATTLTKAYLRDEVQNRRFDTVILDEASMAPIPALWVAAAVAERNVVIVGDPRQLPPIALSADENHQEAPEYRWLARDIFEVSGALDNTELLVSLRTQYRMHPEISALPNALVYRGELNDAPNTTADDGLDPWYRRDWGHDAPVLRIDTEKADAWCSTVVTGGHSSRLNFLSATLVAGLAERLLLEDRDPAPGGGARIIIATPYRPQARLVTLLLREAGLEGEVVAGTVHSLQGSEAPVVIYDLVVDDPHRRAGLFSPQWNESTRRQFNVGLTRARHRLFVVGDFKFLAANGKKAFLGELLARLEDSPRVDAEDVAPLDLSARTAAVRAKVYGQDAEPARSERLVVTQREFDELFVPDLTAAQRRIVIYSPFITRNRLDTVGAHLRAAVERDLKVYVVTKTLNDRSQAEVPGYRELMSTLQRWGIMVVPKKAMHEKLIFIDEDILWVGSLNPLSFRDSREIMERRRSRKIADDYRTTLQLDIAFSAYEEGEASCPICGSEMALAEGDRGTYRRCVVPRCYSRNLTDPPLRDGKMACHACGGELYYGSWGEKPAWRCHDNPKHRMFVHPNHLKLPAMAALLTAKELRRLQRTLHIEALADAASGVDGQGSLLS
jgi:AAA domain/PLD-like domain